MNTRSHPSAVGPYRVVRHLGRGGLAEVYEVESPDDGRRLALKLLTQGGLAVERFSQEYRLLAMIDHRSVVPVLRFGVDEVGRPFFTMPLIDGQVAQSYVRSRGRPGSARRTAASIRVARSLTEALGCLHACGVVHRDVKSGNVLVPRGGRACLIDFGTAYDLRHAHVGFVEGEFVGTHAYAAPEQQQGQAVDGRADLYALGVLIYRLVSGRRPFDHDDPHRLALMHLRERPSRLDRLVGGVPLELARLVEGLLEKRPEDRPDSAQEVQAVLEGLSVRTSPRHLKPRRARLIGRAQEERTLGAALERPRPGRMLLVTGPEGAGRRRLVETVLEPWRDRGWEVRSCALSADSELCGLVDLARMAARGVRGTVPSALLEQLPGQGDDTAQIDQAWLDAVLGELRTRGRPTVLGLWSLHLCSARARDLLGRLREQARAEELILVIVGTADSQFDTPGSVLRLGFADASRIELGPLDRAQTAGLIGELLEVRRAVPELVQATWRATGGLPGLIEVVARTLEEQPGLGSSWLQRGPSGVVLPQEVAEIYRSRIADLSPEGTRLLLCLGLAGEPVGQAVLAAALEWEREALEPVVEGLSCQGYVRVSGDTLDLAIGLAGRLLLEEATPQELDLLRTRLARFLPAAPPRQAHVRLLLAAGWRAEAAAAAVRLAQARAQERRLAELLPLLETVALGAAGLPPQFLAWLAACRCEVGRTEAKVLELLALAEPKLQSTSPELGLAIRCTLAAREPDGAALRACLSAAAETHPELSVELGAALAFRRAELPLVAPLPDRAEDQTPLPLLPRWRCTRDFLAGASAAWDRSGEDAVGWWEGVVCQQVSRLRGDWTRAESLSRSWQERPGRVPLAWFLAAGIETSIDVYRLGEARERLAFVETLVGVGAPMALSVEVDRLAGRLHLAERQPARALARLERAQRQARRWGLELAALRVDGWLARAGLALRVPGSLRHLDQSLVELLDARALVPAIELYGLRARYGGGDPLAMEARSQLESAANRLRLRPLLLGLVLVNAEQAWMRKDTESARVGFGRAHDLVESLQRAQGPEERAALMAHPWKVRIRRGLTLA